MNDSVIKYIKQNKHMSNKYSFLILYKKEKSDLFDS